MRKHKHIIAAVVITYLVMSFVPSLGITSFLGGLTGGAAGGKKKGL